MKIVNKTLFQSASVIGQISFPKHSLTLIVKGTFDLVLDDKVVPSEKQIFSTGEESYPDDEEGTGSCRYESDFAHFKPHSDLLLVGKCCCPSNKPIQVCRVTFQVGEKVKSLAIFGDRYRKGILKKSSIPELFTEMELRYENSFGGEGYKKNPIGLGYKKKIAEDGSNQWLLPNIEDPQNLIRSSFDHPEPVGFGPLGKMWQQRYTKVGTYKGKWLKERWPWFPKDFDWAHFNAAPPDMQVEGYLKGDEELYFENLHPIHSSYHSQLPGLRVRCFLNELHPNDQGVRQTLFREVPMNLDTLWVDMDTEKLVLVWRGVANIKSEEYEEIEHLFIVSEKLEEKNQSLEYYETLFKKTLAEENAEEEYEIKPIEPLEVENTTEVDAEIAKAEHQLQATLIEAGIDPNNLPEPREEDKAKEIQILKELGFEEETEISALTRETVQERIARGEGFAKEDLRGIDLSGLEMNGVDFQEAVLTDVCLKESHLSAANLSGADLSGADLSGATLHGAILKEADCSNAHFDGADLSDAVLEDAIFEKAQLKKTMFDKVSAKDANFSEANLSESSFKEASLTGADFSKSILNSANFQGANLREASVEGAVGIQVNMSGADLTELRASEACNFLQGIFQKTIGLESIWENANLSESDFSYSKMEGADFSSANLERANLSAADMKFSRFTKANLKEAKCIQMNLFQGSLEKADLTRADLRGSNFYEVEFLDAILEETKLTSANLKMTKLSK